MFCVFSVVSFFRLGHIFHFHNYKTMEKLLVLTKYVEKIDKSVIEQQLGKTTEIALKEVHQLFANAEKEGTNFEEVMKIILRSIGPKIGT